MIGIADGVHRVHACRVDRRQGRWPFAESNRAAIERHWALRSRANPKFFNGRVFVMVQGRIESGELVGTLVETDFAASLYWREHDFADQSVADCFGSGLLLTRDGALIFGRQTEGNVNAGLAYPPGGFIDPDDFGVDGRVGFDHSILREVMEETGLTGDRLVREPGYVVTRCGPLLSVGLVLHVDADADAVKAEIAGRLAGAEASELESVVVIRTAEECAKLPMPKFARMIAGELLGFS